MTDSGGTSGKISTLADLTMAQSPKFPLAEPDMKYLLSIARPPSVTTAGLKGMNSPLIHLCLLSVVAHLTLSRDMSCGRFLRVFGDIFWVLINCRQECTTLWSDFTLAMAMSWLV